METTELFFLNSSIIDIVFVSLSISNNLSKFSINIASFYQETSPVFFELNFRLCLNANLAISEDILRQPLLALSPKMLLRLVINLVLWWWMSAFLSSFIRKA